MKEFNCPFALLPNDCICPKGLTLQACLSSADAGIESPLSKSARIVPNQESVNVTDQKSIDDEWIRYTGQLAVITDQGNDLVDTLKNKHKIPNIIEFLTNVTVSCHERVTV